MIVVASPGQTDALFTVTVGNGFMVTIPEALSLAQLVVVSVIITLYVPATVVLKVATFPGLAAPEGTVQS